MDDHFKIQWVDAEREPKCAPNPDFPSGMDAGPVLMRGKGACWTELPYPAKRCGYYLVECSKCKVTAAVTTAGRADDPRSVTIPCKETMQ